MVTKQQSKNTENIKILGIGESSDAYHSATPDPKGEQAAAAIQQALDDAGLKPDDIDYINLHGTGTVSNDLMEANAIFKIFETKFLQVQQSHIQGIASVQLPV